MLRATQDEEKLALIVATIKCATGTNNPARAAEVGFRGLNLAGIAISVGSS